MTNKRGRRRNASSSFGVRIWLIIALLILAGGWVYSSHLKNAKEKERREIQTLRHVKGADAASLLHVTIPDSLPAQIKDYTGFTVNFNASNHTPNYVGWELLSGEINGNVPRDNRFWHDPDIDGCPDIPDYKRSGYDRGHLYPAADAKWSRRSMSDCFTFANMVPQAHSLNSGAWKTLEDKERLWVARDGRLIIIAGPIYTSKDSRRIGAIGVRVPSGFFKILLAPDVDTPRAIAFVYPNDYAPGNMQNYSMSVDEAEMLTGFDFFSLLPDDIESTIESTASFKEWDRRD